MLIMKKSQIKPLFLKLKYFLVFLFCCCSSHIYAQEDEKISFYLPFHSNQFTKNIEKFNEDLISTGFDNFEIKRSDIWQQYQQNIRTGELGVYFAAPHFSAWLIHKHDFIPLYRVDGNLKFVIASRIKDRDIFELSDLIEKKLCTQNPLNLDYLLINKSFKKSIQAPESYFVNSVYDEFTNPDSVCSAFSISEHIYLQQENKKPNKFIRLAQSKVLNNYAFLIHPSLINEYSIPLRKFLIKDTTKEHLSPFLQLLSHKTSLVDAKVDDYPKEYIEELSKYWGKE